MSFLYEGTLFADIVPNILVLSSEVFLLNEELPKVPGRFKLDYTVVQFFARKFSTMFWRLIWVTSDGFDIGVREQVRDLEVSFIEHFDTTSDLEQLKSVIASAELVYCPRIISTLKLNPRNRPPSSAASLVDYLQRTNEQSFDQEHYKQYCR